MLAKFINMVMKSGKKSVAEKIVYGALDRMSERVGNDKSRALEMLGHALDNIKPAVEVKSRRSEKSMAVRLAHELIDAADNRGAAVKKREDTHRMADANRAFAHYRW
jgi:small subunit ribosomal protein S7